MTFQDDECDEDEGTTESTEGDELMDEELTTTSGAGHATWLGMPPGKLNCRNSGACRPRPG